MYRSVLATPFISVAMALAITGIPSLKMVLPEDYEHDKFVHKNQVHRLQIQSKNL